MSPAAKQLYGRFPAIYRLPRWDTLATLAGTDFEAAVQAAQDIEARSIQIRAQNVMARRIRIQRVELFRQERAFQERAREEFRKAAEAVGKLVERSSPGRLSLTMQYVAAVMVVLRRNLVKQTTDAIWQSLKLGLKNTVDAVEPILKDNREARELREEKLSFGLSKTVASRTAVVTKGTGAWDQVIERSYDRLAKKSLAGLTPSERVWQLTKRAELALRSRIRAGFARGDGAPVVARDARNLLLPEVQYGEENPGTGVYANPYKNAARLVRTEMNKAYTTAQAEWASTRSWVQGLMITLSPVHDVEDECDSVAGDVVSPEEFQKIVPLHPHCMCFATYVVKDEYLTEAE